VNALEKHKIRCDVCSRRCLVDQVGVIFIPADPFPLPVYVCGDECAAVLRARHELTGGSADVQE
jgi:hypothetical protein